MENLIINDEEVDFILNKLFSDEYPHFIQRLNEATFSINDLNIQPRDATYWDKQGVLPKIKGTGMRRKYDLVQSFWLKLVQQMRTMGISLSIIKKLKEKMLEPYIEGNEVNHDSLKLIVEKLNAKMDTSYNVDEVLALLEKEQPSIFQSSLMVTVLFRKQIHCLVNSEGFFILYDISKHQELMKNNEEFHEFISQPFFCVNLSKAYQTLVNEWSTKDNFSEFSLLSESELEILKLIRKNDIKKITIRFKNGEPYLIEVDETKTASLEQRFLDVILKNGYQKISITVQNGNIANYENTIQYKIKKVLKK